MSLKKVIVMFKQTPTCVSVTVGNHLSYDIKISSEGTHSEVAIGFFEKSQAKNV